MQARRDRTTILYVTGEYAPEDGIDEQLDTDQMQFVKTTLSDSGAGTQTESPDCLLLGAQARDTQYVDAVGRLRGLYPSTPLIAFTGDRGPRLVERLLDAGVDDVVRSTVAHASEALVRQRVENVLGGRGISEAALDRYETILNTAADAIYQLDASGTVVAVNDAAVDLLGYDRSELVGSPVQKYLDDESVRTGRQFITDQLRNGTSGVRTIEFSLETADGDCIPCEARVAIWTDNGHLAGSVGVVRDVSEEREREQELKRQNDLFEQAQAIADVGAWEYNVEGESIWTEKVYEIFDADRDFEPSLTHIQQYYHPEDWEETERAFRRTLEEGEKLDITVRTAPEAGPRWVHLRGYPQTDEGGITRVRGTVQDITEIKRRERELERHREFLRQSQQVADIGGWEVDFETDELRWTDEVYDIHGLAPGDEPTLAEGIEFYHPEDRQTIRSAIDDLATEGEAYDLECRLVTDDGEVRWVRTWGEPLVDGEEIVGARGVIQSIHDRKQRERELQAERDLVQQIFQTSPVGIVVHDADGTVSQANEQAAALLDLDHEQLSGASYRPSDIQLRSRGGEPLTDGQLPVSHILSTGEPVRDEELVVETDEGDRTVIAVNGVPLFENDELSRVILTFDDVTDRVEREQQLERRRDELAHLARINRIIREVDGALLGATDRTEIEQAVCDRLSDSGRYRYTTALRPTGDGGFESRASYGLSVSDDVSPSLSGDGQCPARTALDTGETQVVQDLEAAERFGTASWRSGLAATGVGSLAVIPLAYGDREYGVIAVCAGETGAFSERELDVLGELGENVGYAISAVESREREATLTSLYEATQDLLAADTRAAVSETVVTTAASVLDPSGIGIFLFDADENVLEAAEMTEQLEDCYDGATTFGPGEADSVTWQTYVSGEEQFFADIRDSETVDHGESDPRSTLFLPLGEHGVFVVASAERTQFENRRLIGLLAATTEAALDRVAGQASIRERDRELETHARRIEQFEQMFSLARDTDQLLRRAGSREEIERGVCERIVDVDAHEFAWVGTVPPEGDRIEPRAWAGETRGYLDSLALTVDSQEPATEAIAGDPVVVENVMDRLREESWAREAVECGYQSVMAVPLVYGETTYGVLVVYGDTPGVFGDVVRPVIAALCETVAHSINTVETERGILAGRVVEVELTVQDTDSFRNAVAAAAGQRVRCREVVPESDGRAEVLFALSEPPVADVLALESEFVAVESLTRVERGSEHLFRATLSGPTLETTLLECGALPQTVTATETETTATVRLAPELDVRAFLDRVRESYPEVELVSRQDIERDGSAREAIETTLAEGLTDRQREVLVTAYESGFFESPRQTTGAELADLLDISQPTVTHHLREAQRRLFSTLLGEFTARI